MDADRFDLLTKSMATPANRRRALGVFTAGGFFGAFLPRGGVAAAQRTTCTLEFVTAVRQGPSASQLLTNDAALPGEARGELSFGLSASGALEDGVLLLTDGTNLPVVGQATGNSLQMRIDAGQGIVFVGVGVGEQDVAACQGAIDGIMSGPQGGDLGDWHAVALGQGTASTGGQTNPARSGGGNQAGGGRPAVGPGTGPGSGSGSTAPSPSGACPPNQTLCGNVCVDVRSDLNNCGSCGNVCDSRLVSVACLNGICERATCQNGLTYCGAGDGCRDLSQDIDHCGGCQQPCADGVECAGGVCIGEPDPDQCGVGLTDCDGVCVDLDDADLHCGACGNVCEDGLVCNGGVCSTAGGGGCVTGRTDCGGTCVDSTTNPLNCGTCGNDCGIGNVCQGGICFEGAPGELTCNQGFENCGGFCVDTSADLLNCGTCGNACNPNAICSDGVCVGGGDPPPPPPACNPGLTDCGGVCVDLTNNALHCGTCFLPCAEGQVCQGNSCLAGGPACGPGLTACGGVCLDLNNDPFACGACTNICPEGASCQGRQCVAPPD